MYIDCPLFDIKGIVAHHIHDQCMFTNSKSQQKVVL